MLNIHSVVLHDSTAVWDDQLNNSNDLLGKINNKSNIYNTLVCLFILEIKAFPDTVYGDISVNV